MLRAATMTALRKFFEGKMKQYKCEIEASVVSALERLSFEYETRKDNVAFLLENHADDPGFLESALFQKYQQEEFEAKKAFETAKQEFQSAYVPSELREHKISWSLDYQTKILTITQHCDCEVELCGENLKTLTIA